MKSAEKEKKVLIITYYWPPSGGSGVQRWLKFVKYLPEFGWRPYVFTPENPAFETKDPSLLNDVPDEAEVIHFPIWEPYELFGRVSKLFGSGKAEEVVKKQKKSRFEKISTWLRGNLLIPDPRKFWVKPSVKFLSEFLQENRINTIITTGPPHSIHLIGLELKQKHKGLRWIADLRDPWSEWGLLDTLMVSTWARARHRALEFSVLSTADVVTTISPFYVRHFENLGKRKVMLLPNGYDETDFKNLQIARPSVFTIRHVGIVNEKCNPRPFMLALKSLIEEDERMASTLRLEFVGDVNRDFQSFVHNIPSINQVTRFIPPVPHKKLIDVYGTSSVLLLVLTGYKDAVGYMPGKLYEYLATGLPIMAIGPVNGDAAALLRDSKAGEMIADDNTLEMKRFLRDAYQKWEAGTFGKSSPPEAYSRRRITEKLIEIL